MTPLQSCFTFQSLPIPPPNSPSLKPTGVHRKLFSQAGNSVQSKSFFSSKELRVE